MRCRKCGINNPDNTNKCLYCGASFIRANGSVPVNRNVNNRQQSNKRRSNNSSKKQRAQTDNIIIGIIIALVAVLLIIGGAYAFNSMPKKGGFRSGGGGGGGGGGITSSSNVTYTVTFDLNYDGAGEPPEAQVVKHGEYAMQPETPKRDGYNFIGWYLSKDEKDWKNYYKFSESQVVKSITLYAFWVNPNKDTDGDGLIDDYETYLTSDINNKDTDGDGLTDFQEVSVTGTNPVLKDTDGDGIDDYNDDEDGDKLINGEEIKIGTNPIFVDSDTDTLSDYDEINVHKTSPVKVDTDADGANDDWEIANGFDPCKANSRFDVTASSEKITANNLVSASVSVTLKGSQVESLSVEPVSVADNGNINPSIPGFLGRAYDFSVDGNISSAEITFNYDTSLGTIGPDFQPRIYYVNNSTKELEELKNQSVSDGKVTAVVSHFSEYLLINKVDYDNVWYTQIIKPSGSGVSSIDVTFTIDVSSSMKGDKIQTAKTAISSFVDALDDDDRAALVSFNSDSSLIEGLISNKAMIKSKVSNLSTSGKTAMYKGLRKAIDLYGVQNENYGYKIIVLLSDGKDEPSTNYDENYKHLVEMAANNDIMVYTVGVGNGIDSSVLQKIAQDTGGEYYHVSETSGIHDAFEKIQQNAIDMKKDSNEDGISDYYTEKIKEGKLVLSTGSREFKYVDFNSNADWDGDGLKNGDELDVVTKGDRVYIYMKSNPTLKNSDGDIYDDKTEVENNTDPMRYNVSASSVNFLREDQNFDYENMVEVYDNNWLFKADTTFLSIMFGVWNVEELHRDILINYFSKYCTDAYVKNAQKGIEKKDVMDVGAQIIKVFQAGEDNVSFVEDAYKVLNEASAGKTAADVEKARSLLSSLASKIEKSNSKSAKIMVSTKKVGEKVSKCLSKMGITLDVVCDGISYASYAWDVIDTVSSFSKLSANIKAFESNAEILIHIKENSDDVHAKMAAAVVLDSMAKNFAGKVHAIASDGMEIAGKAIIAQLANANIYVLAVTATIAGFDILLGINDDIEQLYEMICYERMVKSLKDVCDKSYTASGSVCYVGKLDIDKFERYMIHLSQMRILGEKKYCEYQKLEGFIGWFANNEEIENRIKQQIEYVKALINKMGLSISPIVSG